jgi:uncharacterized protein YneR
LKISICHGTVIKLFYKDKVTFIFTKNLSRVTGADGWYQLKELLKTAGWVVKSSGDGLSAFSSTTDIITSGSSGAGGMNNSNAWYRIQMPIANGVHREFTIQRGGSSISATIKYSFSTNFTSGAPNSTTTPTASDEVSVFSGSVWSSDNTYHINIGADNAAPYGFWMAIISNANVNGTSASGGFVLDPMAAGSYPSQDPDPYIMYCENTSAGSFTANKISSQIGKSWLHKGLSTESYGFCGGCSLQAASVNLFPNVAGTDPFSLKHQISPILWARNLTTGYVSIKGIGTLIKWNGEVRVSGQTLSLVTTSDRICISDINLPWDGSVVVI